MTLDKMENRASQLDKALETSEELVRTLDAGTNRDLDQHYILTILTGLAALHRDLWLMTAETCCRLEAIQKVLERHFQDVEGEGD